MTRKIATLLLIGSFLVPVASAQPWYHSKKFWVQFGIVSAASFADARTTRNLIARGGVELNPVFGASKPSLPRLVGIGLPLEFVGSVANESLNKRHSWIPVALIAGTHIGLAYHNSVIREANVPEPRRGSFFPIAPRGIAPRLGTPKSVQ